MEVTERKIADIATKEDLANVKSRLIKWMFVFWIGQMAIVAGICYYCL